MPVTEELECIVRQRRVRGKPEEEGRRSRDEDEVGGPFLNKFLEGEAQIPHIPHVPDIPRQSRRSLFMQEGDPIRPLVQGRMQLAHCSDFQCRHHTGIIAAHCSYVHGKLHSSSSGQESHQGATRKGTKDRKSQAGGDCVYTISRAGPTAASPAERSTDRVGS